MKSYDWIVVGGGITGAALSYELAKKGFTVLLLEKYPTLKGATRYSYAILPYWSGTTDLTNQLFQEAKERYHCLSEELETNTQFRELDSLLTIALKDDPEKIAAAFKHYNTVPRLISVQEACEMEPLLNKEAIAGALTIRNGHVSPEAITLGYSQALTRLGGQIEIAEVTGLVKTGDNAPHRYRERITGVYTTDKTYHAANVVICAGGISRHFLKSAGIPTRVYFTHAEMLEIPPVELQLNTSVLTAVQKRFQCEAATSTVEFEQMWDEPGHEFVPFSLDAGAIQFKNGSIRIGQISRVLTDPYTKIDPTQSEVAMRSEVGKVLPALENLPATWYHCLVAYSADDLPLIGAIPHLEGIHIFSGFSSPFAFVPPLAKRFANYVAGENDEIVKQLSPHRFV
ncbi:MAG: FAD-binding oxidoreductase [Okeania sp. SIO2G4]|uniref:NAD(P)/FAD-dependent oxidoreductase n=1 Tax=unclassified Okeania TaxID=2634635 RepID=UPI0013BA766D|nr:MULTISPECIES: FAD-binding oxidoreductase [unclassified Okeania]NEP07063.1 FAD-binding oxidoreductase [Okeania sp. SIO4D6]NEP40028.1 FAD-binding oxidoreductase [Okeania sp. SIO2H7]NEP71141.1 FAD-binding oxidoreductase [Okeania sp. SIO2G5]NEP92056.1 FAD-binding oxidoreductase [Okeania sp. SIO2F5]NEQ94916.1 FAD-binding oxidoreductase [Okeania sp. SIO2G4]